MAIDNLSYYSSWLPAWQQTDKYSRNPWCLKSKNLDIFSSSKSVKATAFSEPTIWDDDIIASEWWLVLKTDWKVYERVDGVDTLFVDPSQDFPVYKVSYTWKSGTYADAQWGTPQDMSVVTENGEWKSFIVYTDRASYLYSKVKFTPEKTTTGSGWVLDTSYDDTDSVWKGSGTLASSSIAIECEDRWFSKIPINITNLSGQQTVEKIRIQKRKYAYDAELDAMVDYNDGVDDVITSYTYWDTVYVPNIPWSTIWIFFSNSTTSSKIRLNINKSGDMDMYWHYMIWDWDSNYYYSYLPVRDHLLQRIWVYSWMKWSGFQILYHWDSSRVDVNGFKKTRYDFVQYMWWANDPWMDVIWMIEWNEQVYMIGNLSWDWYIIPCDLTWSKWTPYIAYGCTFRWVTNIDYLLYLVWEDRGISTLWVFNQQELVPVIWWKQEKQYNDIVGVDEQYRFDWKILNWRKNLILTTTDNRIFQYGQTYGGKGWSFIHNLPSNAVITWLNANGNDLVINYSVTVNNTTAYYVIKYQDDTPIKNYNTEWEAVYPIQTNAYRWNKVVGTHLTEKEDNYLYASYILPSAACKLEFWAMANHYYFWTFKSSDNATLSESEDYKIKWTSWTYALKFIEKNGNEYTFRLEWNLPVNTTGEKQIIDSNNAVVINYSDFHHFRRIWEITTDRYLESYTRFTNLNNKLELPETHSLQVMVRGKWNQNYTAELFNINLVANQRDRW